MPAVSGNSFWSICTSLSVGCYVYDDPALTVPAASGYYSNGTTCYTVSGGQITVIGACTTNVTITLYYDPSADGGGGVSVAAQASEAIDGYVTAYFTWYGDNGATISQNLTIGSGQTCASNTFTGATAGENVINFTFDSITDGSSTQTFVQGTTNSTFSHPC